MANANLALQVADRLRDELMRGRFAPGQRLSEPGLCDLLSVSRNTLREGFRLLTRDGLLTHIPNRGVFVSVPSAAAIEDLYRIRRMVECHAMRQAYPLHPAKHTMRAVMLRAQAAREAQDWHAVGELNMAFHEAVVALGDSERTSMWFSRVLAELRWMLGLLQDPELLHGPSVERNQRIFELVLSNQFALAADTLHDDLTRIERIVLALHARRFESAAGED